MSYNTKNKRPVYYNLTEGFAWTHTPQGDTVIVSMCDRDLIENHSVTRHMSGKAYYARIYVNQTNTTLHKEIQKRIGFDGLCDHRNRNKLDNRRENLRKSTHSLNSRNISMRKTNITGFMGITKKAKGYETRIGQMIKGRYKISYMGYFTDILEAALAYDIAARTLHGLHSTTNETLGNYSKTDPSDLTKAYANLLDNSRFWRNLARHRSTIFKDV
ncbi:putative AP2-endonuclease [Acaryochloris phage A-HIS1]|nr:putative AP2-endonuclease [Acaryochloris phage A-HIS1]